MARTPSTMIPLGTPMPAFELPDAHGDMHASTALTGSVGTMVVFMCNHCPFVVHVADRLGKLARSYGPRGIAFVGITSNDLETYPQDGPAGMNQFAAEHDLSFPYLLDESQAVARAFDAACTPDFYLYAHSGELVYRGQFDDSRPDAGTPVTGHDLSRAMDALLEGEPILDAQVPSLGCNIKWKPTD